jgi:hypothetical protein
MDALKIAEIGSEGSIWTFFGRQCETGWRFWCQHDFMCDDYGVDWASSQSKETADLESLLPFQRFWIKLDPIYIHPDFRSWFKERYDNCYRELTKEGRKFDELSRKDRMSALSVKG